MFARLFRRLRSVPTLPPRRASPPVPGSSESLPRFSGAAAPVIIDAPSSAAPPELRDRLTRIGDGLERDLRARVGELDAALSDAERSGDAPRFLAEVGESLTAIIRQPPLAAQRALDLTRQPGVPLTNLVRCVERDPTLVQALLRFANSAHYAMPGAPCVALTQAVQRVGISGVHSVVLGQIAQGLLCRPGAAYERMVQEVWSHMVRTAPIARALAPGFGLPPDEAFTLGLLHDVGKLILFDLIGTLRGKLRRDLVLAPPFLSAALRTLHEPLGGATALRWGLGGAEASAIAFHHRSPVPPPSYTDRRSELLFIAEQVDLAVLRAEAPDLETWWRAGGLRSPRGPVELQLAAATLGEETAPAVHEMA